jgi:hypothetical protein
MDSADFPLKPVTINANSNIYRYTRWQLLSAYGIAMMLTLFAGTIGLVSLYRNKAAYSNSFSSIIRVTRESSFNLVIDVEDSGTQPTPSSVQNLKVTLDESKLSKDQKPIYSIRSCQSNSKDISRPRGNEERWSGTTGGMESTASSIREADP